MVHMVEVVDAKTMVEVPLIIKTITKWPTQSWLRLTSLNNNTPSPPVKFAIELVIVLLIVIIEWTAHIRVGSLHRGSQLWLFLIPLPSTKLGTLLQGQLITLRLISQIYHLVLNIEVTIKFK